MMCFTRQMDLSECKNPAESDNFQVIFSLSHIEGITLEAGEEVDDVAGGASGMGVDGIGEVGDRTSKGQAAVLKVIK